MCRVVSTDELLAAIEDDQQFASLREQTGHQVDYVNRLEAFEAPGWKQDREQDELADLEHLLVAVVAVRQAKRR